MKIRHVDIYRRPGEFAGWPANYGLWSWSREIVVMFARGHLGKKGEIHELDRDQPFVPLQARSLDSGVTWRIETFNGWIPGGPTLSADEHVVRDLKARPRINPSRDFRRLERPIDFLDSETIVLAARTGLTGDAVSWFYVSQDRARTWRGPYRFEGLDLAISARTDVVPLGSHDALFMLTTAKSDGGEGRVFAARTQDGGRHFEFQGFVGEEPAGYTIMPASTRLPDDRIVALVRRMDTTRDEGWIEGFASDDLGRTWSPLGRAVDDTGFGGNPAALAKADDGRLVLVYGCRRPPFGIRMRSSSDGGRTWGGESIIRDDGGTPDLGYPRLVRLDGRTFLTVYYFCEGDGEERFIAGSMFELS